MLVCVVCVGLVEWYANKRVQCSQAKHGEALLNGKSSSGSVCLVFSSLKH